ncbi:hypothetical protein CONCODRAFT_11971 [Conidiobolus coronatus NRRL 28638]|uniref:G-protein coupled receptors family 1 profile domain-containing protein n=1 Tax=Conidiobolus coronatus (strain ATCC 28846 / CBS 209.66 / NRRL 28638) TaxID=796925 RepID=A0A137NU85_CONC2|nr:hypothetical protein CONCODRAFT_11971 [Conidiobolus coronatus NRRL 28638]|eukprot:KXN66231.1 hypothetical protein CONCODRAFT_11971 [Conidiobolus coronatus NRRL 28638]
MEIIESSGTTGLIFEIVDIVLAILSFCLNVLVAHILVKRLGLTQCDTVVSFIICIIDLLYSIFSGSCLIIVWATHYQLLQTSNYFCQFNGFFYTLIISSVADIIMILAVLRYLAICCNRIYSIKCWVIISSLFIIFNAACSIVSVINSAYRIYPSIKYCTFNGEKTIGLTIWYILGIKEFIALIIIVFCYLRIARHYSKYLNDIRKDSNKLISQFHPKESLDPNKNGTNSQLILDYGEAETKVKSSIKKLYIIISIYAIEFLGFLGIQTIFKFIGTLPNPVWDNIFSVLSHTIPLTSPLFILFFHDETNHELQSMLYIMSYRLAKKIKI